MPYHIPYSSYNDPEKNSKDWGRNSMFVAYKTGKLTGKDVLLGSDLLDSDFRMGSVFSDLDIADRSYLEEHEAHELALKLCRADVLMPMDAVRHWTVNYSAYYVDRSSKERIEYTFSQWLLHKQLAFVNHLPRRVVKPGVRGSISPSLRNSVIKRDQGKCRYCLRPCEKVHLDHVYPVALGGHSSYENLVVSCSVCNQKKGVELWMPEAPEGKVFWADYGTLT